MSKETIRFETINEKIKDTIKKEANDTAVETVIEASVKREVEMRSETIEKGLKTWSKAKADFNKCRADVVTYEPVLDKEGKDTGAEPVKVIKYSENKYKEKQKLSEEIAKLDMALLKALGEEGNYEKLKSLVGNSK